MSHSRNRLLGMMTHLSEFLKLAEYNDRVTSLNHPIVFELLKDVDTAFKEV